MAELRTAHASHEMGMHTEQLAGRTQQRFFKVDTEASRFTYPLAPDVDFNKRAEFDAAGLDTRGSTCASAS